MYRSILILSLLSLGFLVSCNQGNTAQKTPKTFSEHNLKQQEPVETDLEDIQKIYVPIYSEIYQRSRDDSALLTATLSIRNTSEGDSLFLKRVDYFDTKGILVRKYLNQTIYLKPLETIDYVIDEKDNAGGTGANFIIEYYKRERLTPLFQAVMVGGLGNNSFSFTTAGVETE